MSFFVSYFSTTTSLPNASIFEDALPLDPTYVPPKVTLFTGKNNRLFVWSYMSETDRPIVFKNNEALWTEGYAPETEISLEQRLQKIVNGVSKDTCGSFCGVWHKPESVICYTSISGNFSLFVYKTDSFIAISNRINLLAALGSLRIRNEWLIYMCGARRALDFGTAFEDITTTTPGELIRIQSDKIHFVPPNLNYLFEPMEMSEAISTLYSFPEYLKSCLSQFNSLPFTVSLTGGKDSRAVLSMLDIAGIMDIPGRVRVMTGNLQHDAEFLSAQRQLDLFEHYIPHISASTHQPQKNLISNVVHTLFRRGFSHDLVEIAAQEYVDITTKPTDTIYFGGTDYNLKVWLRSIPTLRNYLLNTKNTLHMGRLIQPEPLNKSMIIYHTLLKTFLQNLPKQYYFQLESWWITLSRVFSCILLRGFSLFVLPFIDTAFWKFFLSAPKELFTTHAAYYLLMRKAKHPLWKVPFCELDWPLPLTLFLYKHKLPVDGLDNIPYRFNPYFPGQKSQGRVERLDALINITQTYIREKTKQHKEFFNFVSQEGLDELTLQPAEKIDFIHECCGSGLLCSILLVEYGQKLLQRSQLTDIQHELTDILKGPKGLVQGINIEEKEEERDLLYDRVLTYENCLTDVTQQLYSITSKCRYEWLKNYPELLEKMGFIDINNTNYLQTFDVTNMKSFTFNALILGPAISVHRPSPLRINPPALIIKPDITTVFLELHPIRDYWCSLGQLKDGVIQPWEIYFAIPEEVKSITCFLCVFENSMPIFISDIKCQSRAS